MSGIEVIGLVLGGLPLIISAAEDYKRGFEPFMKWHRYKREFRGFINSVDLEKQMFDGLLAQLLRYTDLPLEEQQQLLSGKNYEAWQREETTKALKVRLGDSYLSCMFILGNVKEDMIMLQNMMSLKDGSVDWAKPGEDKWNYQRKRIAHSFSKKGIETVASLEKNNRKFRELLDLLDRKLIEGPLNHGRVITKDTSWARIFESIRHHAANLHSALKKGWGCNCISPHLANLQLQERRTGVSPIFALIFASPRAISTPSALRKVIVAVNEGKNHNETKFLRPQPAPVQKWFLDDLRDNFESKSSPESKSISFLSSNSSVFARHSLSQRFMRNNSVASPSTLQNGSVTEGLVDESRSESTVTVRKSKIKKTVRMTVPADSEDLNDPKEDSASDVMIETSGSQALDSTEDIEVKIDNLCSTLEAFDGVDSTLGYLSDDADVRYEIRSVKDNSIPTDNAELISLEKLLSCSGRPKLSRKQRFRLAQILASSLLQLQTTPWITDPLDKSHIFFYRQESEIVSEEPFIRHAFLSDISNSNSSPADEPAQVETRFATRSSTRRSLVSLGILLLELCFGQAIEDQTEIRRQYLLDGKAHNDTNYLVARDWIYEVGEEAGEEFENAVKFCVLCNFDAKLNWTDTNFIQSVYGGVVQPLEKAIADLGWSYTS